MQYEYLSIYKISGLTLAPDSGDTELYANADGSFKAILSGNINSYCNEIDRSKALGYLMLRGMVGQDQGKDQTSILESEIAKIRESRNKEINSAAILIINAKGAIDANLTEQSNETADYIIGFDVFDKKQITTTYNHDVNAVLAALFLAAESENLQIIKVCQDAYLINPQGKPIYSISFSLSGEAYCSSRTTPGFIEKAQSLSCGLISEKYLPRVISLLMQAISKENDKFRRFIFAWSALEILINQVFSTYEKMFISKIVESAPSNYTEKYFSRINDVMKDKYRLTDKFVIITACFSENGADDDIALFKNIKEIRNNLFHGSIVDENTLPINDTVTLLKKYLGSHISRKPD